jgi:6-phosphogluconolactonase
MKFSKLSQLFLVSAIGLALATLLTACQLVSIDIVYLACSAGTTAGSAGEIQIYDVDAGSGALRTSSASISSGGTTPVSLAVTSDSANLYVANQGNKTVVHFAIAGSGVLTQKDTVTLPATPVYIAVNSAGTYLYVVSGTASATLTEYGLSSGTIGSAAATISLTLPSYPTDTILPTAVAVLPDNNAVYVAAVDKSAYNPGGTTTSNANPGWLFGYSVGSGGALTATAGSPYQGGVKPSALAIDPTNRFVYLTDYASNELVGYTVQSSGNLNFMVNGPFKTGNEPSAVTIDPRGVYIYVSNALDNSVSAFTISLPTGTPSAVIGAGFSNTNVTDTQPVSIIVEPALGRYVYTANYLGNSISGFLLNANTGAINPTEGTPYPTGAIPTAVVAIPHGNHAVQVVTP